MTVPPLWKRVLRHPKRALYRAGEMVASAVFVAPGFQPVRSAIMGRQRPPAGLKAAMLAHVYYVELWDEIRAMHAALPAGSPLLVTAPPANMAALRGLAGGDPLIRLIEHPNRGRDIAPFVHVLGSGALDGFDAVLKVHTKKSPHLMMGDLRRRALYAALAGSTGAVSHVLAQFGDQNTGVVGPGPYFRARPSFMMDNRPMVERLAGQMEAEPRVGFFEGSMFWFRPGALMPLRELGLQTTDFDAEAGQIDGTLHHAVERLPCLAAARAGFVTRTLGGKLLFGP